MKDILNNYHQLVERFNKVESIEGKDVITVPGSRRGMLTSNHILAFDSISENYGVPSRISVVPIPGTSVAKYLSTMIDGLPYDTQRNIVSEFSPLGDGNTDFFISDADGIKIEKSSFNQIIGVCEQYMGINTNIRNVSDEIISQLPDNSLTLADALSALSANLATKILHKNGKETVVTPELPSVTREKIPYFLGEKKKKAVVFPENLLRETASRFEDLVNNGILSGYLENDSERYYNSLSKLNEVFKNIFHSSTWNGLVERLNLDMEIISSKIEHITNHFFQNLMEQFHLDDQNRWEIFAHINPSSLSLEFVTNTLHQSVEPSKYLKTLDENNRPKIFHNGKESEEYSRYYPGFFVLSYILQRAQSGGLPVIMQNLGNRPETLEKALEVSGVNPGSIQTANANSAYPLQDQSLFVLFA